MTLRPFARWWVAALLGGLVLCASARARAQCGAPASSCRQCHEIEGRSVPAAAEPWHADHAFGDFCASCHGGVATVHDEAGAHVGLVDPLDSSAERCVSCHPRPATLLAKYATPGPDGRRALGVSGAPRPPASPPSPPPRSGSVKPGTGRGDAAAATLAMVLALAGGAYVVWNERRRREHARTSLLPTTTDAAWTPHLPKLTDAEWSPYVSGALLGVVVAVSMAIFNHRLSGGGAYQQIAAPVGRLLGSGSVYWDHVVRGGARWELPALLGALLGSFAAARAGGGFRVRTMPDSQWAEAFGASVATRWVVGFLGAALTEFAAGIAGGCTASLAMSGGAALAPGAFAFMAGMFAGGIPAAAVVYRKGRAS